MKKSTQKKSNKLYTLYALHLPLLVLLVALMALGSYTFVKANPGINSKISSAAVLGDDDEDEEEDEKDDDEDEEDDEENGNDDNDEDGDEKDEDEHDEDDDDGDDDENEIDDELEDDNEEENDDIDDEDDDDEDDDGDDDEGDDNKTEIQYEREGNKVQIQVESNGKHYKFSSNDIDVNSTFPLRVGDDGTTLYVTTPEGEIALGNVPEMIREQTEAQVMAAGTKVDDIEIKYNEKDSRIEYKLKGEKDESLLGLVKVKVKVEDVYDADTNEFIRSEQNFFAKLLDLLSF